MAGTIFYRSAAPFNHPFYSTTRLERLRGLADARLAPASGCRYERLAHAEFAIGFAVPEEIASSSTSRLLMLPLALLLLVPALAGCGPDKPAQNPLEYTENARREYEEALRAYFDSDWEEAVLLFQEVKRKYGYSRYARLAELRIADAAYHQEKFPEAISGYKAFVHDYPNDAEVPYARYKVAKALFAQSSSSFLLPPLEERDLAAVNDAYATVRAFLADFPNYRHARELEYMLESDRVPSVTALVRPLLTLATTHNAAVTLAPIALRNFEARLDRMRFSALDTYLNANN